MDEIERKQLLKELNDLHKGLTSFERRKEKRKTMTYTESQIKGLDALRQKLKQKYRWNKEVISKYGGDTSIKVLFQKWDVFDYSLSLNMAPDRFTALDKAIEIAESAIKEVKSLSIPLMNWRDIKVTKKQKEQATKAIPLFTSLQLHPKVIEVSQSLFETGHYSPAIFEAFKAVSNLVKEKTGLSLDDKDLMTRVFNEDNPIIKLNEGKTRSDRNEQEGFRFLFMGAIVGIRNPKAHETVIQTDPYKTLEYLAFASLLMRRVEEGKITKSRTRKSKLSEEPFVNRCIEGKHQNAIDLYHKIKGLLDKRKDDYINWGVSGYSYRMPWKGYPNGETIFTALSDSKLTIWPDLLARAGKIGEKYLEKLRNMPALTNEFRKHKYPTISTDLMETSDIDKFIAAIKELGDSLDEASREQ